MKRYISLIATLCLMLGMHRQSNAQDVMQSIMDANANTQYNYMSSQINKDVMANMYKNKGAADKSADVFTYYKMPSFTGGVVKQVGARLNLSTQVINQMQRLDYDNLFNKLTKGYNLKYNDVADILTAYQIQSWSIANSVTAQPSQQSVSAFRSQVRRSLALNKAITTDGKTRAQLGEELKILLVFSTAGWQGAQQQGKAKAYSDGIAQNYQQQYKQDLRSLKLDDKGMHP